MKIDLALELEFKNDISDVMGNENVRKFSGKTILITGGSGFLGTFYKLFLLNANNKGLIDPVCKVISVDNYVKGTTTINDEIIDTNLTIFNHDLTVPLGVKLGNLPIDYIINCAGNAAPKNYEMYPLETMEISTIGTKNLLELAMYKKSKILNFSSSEVLGTPPDDQIPSNENVLPSIISMDKRSPYDVTKLYIETLSWVFKNKYGVDCKVIRPFNVIGRFSQNDYRVIPNFLNKISKDEKIEVFKPGTQTRTFCYYTDFIAGSLLVLLNGNDLLYHIGNPDNEIGIYDLAMKLQEVCGKTDLVSLIETPILYKNEPKRRCPSVDKAKQELGYSPRINLDEMLNRIYKWSIANYK
jgi:nucleoside-diphosphate-sugar epimerase